jgi:thioredoxin reductase (NADPH)
MGDTNKEATTEKVHDVLITGAGPGGMAAAVYAGRARLDTVLLDPMGAGGQMNTIDVIENYPGFAEPQTGAGLAEAMRLQAERFGVQVTTDGVERVEAFEDRVVAHGSYGSYAARFMIVASGARHRHLGVPGEDTLHGRGVSYCATCDGAFFRGQHVVVVGGGDTAVKEALFLARVVDRVTVVHRRDRLRAEAVMQEKALSTPNLAFVWDTVVERVLGDREVTGVATRHVKTGETGAIACAGVFVFVGVLPNAEFLKGVVALDAAGFVKTDAGLRATHPRIYAAGDVRCGSVRQIASAVGDGTTAMLHIQELLDTSTPPRDVPRICPA